MTTFLTVTYSTGGDGATVAITAEEAAAEADAIGARSSIGVLEAATQAVGAAIEGGAATGGGAAVEGGAATGGGAFRAGNVPGGGISANSASRFFWWGGSNR